jgi:hypothetical protein
MISLVIPASTRTREYTDALIKNIEEISSTKLTVNSLQAELDSLKEDIGEIKQMLFSLTQKGK